uniref:hypothetical protein n=1 Tax=Fulvivirga sp. TaxID=1931237 RepID=UPI00404A9F42
MKTSFKTTLIAGFLMIATIASAQVNRALQYDRLPGKAGLNIFETSKVDTVEYDEMRVRLGGDFSILFQGLSQDNSLVGDTLVDLSSNFSLPTANLNIDVQIADGVRMHLRAYLSSRNHAEAWVKGGYFQVDKLDFIKPGFLSGLMEYATLRFGMDEINYGDAHFRRSDNARSMYNPFVGNYIMDAFTTEPFGEITLQKSGWLGVLGISNGRLNQSPLAGDDGIVVFGKVGYDKQINDDLRLRLTGSFYNSGDKSTRDYLYNGDRAGARYYNVLEGINDSRVSNFLPRFNPNFGYQSAFQINPFVKFQGLEFFGIYESVENGADGGGDYAQLGAELLYRFGSDDQLYIGGRYNKVDGKSSDTAGDIEIARTNLGFGWFLTDYVMTKLEYVNSSYDGDGFAGSKFQGAEFNGVVIEAVISF